MAQQQASITVKSKLVGENDLRRVTLPAEGLTFVLLAEKLRTLYAYKDISKAKIKYLDPENDKITISSDEELREALKLIASDSILRLFIVPARQPGELTGETVSLDERIEAATAAILKDVNNPALDDEIRGFISTLSTSLPNCVQRKPTERRLMRILRRRVFQTMNDKALRLLDSTKPENFTHARDLLQGQLGIFPNDIYSMYNLACSESLLNNKDAACAALRKSVDMGFNRLQAMQNDKDLDNIRNEVLYTQIVTELEKDNGRRGGCRKGRARFGGRRGRCGRGRGGRGRGRRHRGKKFENEGSDSEQSLDGSVEEEPSVEEQPQEPVEPEEEDATEIPEGITQSAIDTANDFARSLESLSGMGFSDRKSNIEALVHSRGDLTGAVKFLLDN
mmetsp:Transcript_2655/g.2966  ORF Transcript_2655/g.2966 Transcript_2655/m.2966 type:complete len:393 (-) Transcript_2655:96-1274(-)